MVTQLGAAGEARVEGCGVGSCTEMQLTSGENARGEEKRVWVELRGTVLSGWRVSEREESRLPASQVSASRRKGWSGVHFS